MKKRVYFISCISIVLMSTSLVPYQVYAQDNDFNKDNLRYLGYYFLT